MPSILELFKGSTQDTSVKMDNETFVEQETTGTRVRSAVELNNPLLYGNEAIRIVNRTTSTLDSMKSATGGEEGDGGLIGKGLSKLTGGKVSSISQARDAVNSKLGIPITPNPSRLTEDIIKLGSSEPVTKDSVGSGLQGTGLGQFLKETGGGNPKTLGKQALGNGIGLVKDKVRGALFGNGQTIGEAVGEPVETNYSDTNTYTKVLKDNRNYKSEGGEFDPTKPNAFDGNPPTSADDKKSIDLSLVSPIYGTKRKDTLGVFGRGNGGTGEYAFQRGLQGYNSRVNYFDPNNTYTTFEGQPSGKNNESLSNKYGLSNGTDMINLLGSGDYDSIDEFGVIKKGDDTYQDLIPFNIGKVGDKRTIFRATITSLTENVSPSWNSQKFLGNPFPFYTYNQIERSTSFNLRIFCGSPLELATNWEKIESLTKMAYPNIKRNTLINPPIIQFRLGDIYYDKYGFIETLTYTIPDNSTWEIDGENLGYLPKLIDVAVTIKFMESLDVINSMYGYKKSKAAIEKINEDNNASDFDESSISTPLAGKGFGEVGRITPDKAPKISTRGVVLTKPELPTADLSGLSKLKGLNTKTGGLESSPSTAPKDTDTGVTQPIKSQSAIADKLEGKTPIEASKEVATKEGLPKAQATMCTVYKTMGYKEITRNQVDAFPRTKEWIRDDVGISKFFFRLQNKKYDIYQVPPNGNSIRIDGGWEHEI